MTTTCDAANSVTHLFFLDLNVVRHPVVICNRATADNVVIVAVLIENVGLQ